MVFVLHHDCFLGYDHTLAKEYMYLMTELTEEFVEAISLLFVQATAGKQRM